MEYLCKLPKKHLTDNKQSDIMSTKIKNVIEKHLVDKKGRYDHATIHIKSPCPVLYTQAVPNRQGIRVGLPYEVFEHTADIGLHAYGQTLPKLCANAAAGMESLMVASEQVEIKVSREVSVEGHDLVSLLVSWLNELIFLFDTEYLLLRQIEIITFTETHLTATVSGEPYDSTRHDLSSAIKAVTWHEATVKSEAEGYKARIIFDI